MYCESRAQLPTLPRCDNIATHVVIGVHNTTSISGDGTGRVLWFKMCDKCSDKFSLGVRVIPISIWGDD